MLATYSQRLGDHIIDISQRVEMGEEVDDGEGGGDKGGAIWWVMSDGEVLLLQQQQKCLLHLCRGTVVAT